MPSRRFSTTVALPILAAAALTMTPPAFADTEKSPSIQSLLDTARDEQPVKFEGTVERALDEDLYILSDTTAEIRVDSWVDGKGAVRLPVGQRIVVTGEMDRAPLAKPEVYLRSFEKVSSPGQTPGSQPKTPASPEESLMTIREIRDNAADGQQVVFRGEVARMSGDDAYILDDGTARIKVEAWIEGRGHVPLPVGETVEVHGHMDREWFGHKEIYLHEFKSLD